MKRILLIILILFTSLLTSCSIFYKTPELVNEYDRISFEYSEASHEEWSRRAINDSWSYSQGFYGNGKSGNYFHLYKDGVLAYSYEANDSFNANNILYKDNKIYFILTLYADNKDMLGFIDEEYKYNLLYESNNSLSSLSLGENIVFIEGTREINTVSNIISLDYRGNVLNSYTIASELGYFYKLIVSDSSLILVASDDTLANIYLYKASSNELKKLASLPNMSISKISYIDNSLYVLGYKDFYEDFDLASVCIYEYKNNELNILFEIEMPKDYGYSRSLFLEYENNIYLSFSVAIKDGPKSLYSRHIVLKCNIDNKKIEVLYLNKMLSYNAYYSNGHIYLGNYNNSYVNNEASGAFIDIALKQFN